MIKRQSATGLGGGFRWLAKDFLSSRRRWQALAVLVLMLIGGLAELFTLAAVFPLLALMADPDSFSQSRPAGLLRQVGIEIGDLPLLTLAAAFGLVALGSAAVRILLAWASQKFVFRLGYDLGVSLYERMLYQPYSFHAETNSSRIQAEIGNVQRLLTGMFLPLMQAFSSMVLGIFIVGALLLIDPQVALAAIIGFGAIYLVISLAMQARLKRISGMLHAMKRKRIQVIQEGLGAIRDVLIDNSQPVYVKKFSRLDQKLRDAQAANALIAVAPRYLVEALGMIFIVALAVTLVFINGSLINSLPVLAVLALGAQRLMPLLQQIYRGWSMYAGSTAMFLGVIELLQRPIPQRFQMQSEPLPFDRLLQLDDVSFRYAQHSPLVLDGIALEIPRGSRVGFVGKSGSGKSTLTDLIMGLLQPTSGTVKVDGLALSEDTILAWQQQIAHVSQHIFLADATIAENIAFGLPRTAVDMDRVREACRKAEVDEFIQSLPDQYETMAGERGVRLSGGQRQRIGIARALYKHASLLILDEATSALDDETEAAIVESLQHLGREYTILMIAHRITTLRGCDVIYRLDRGRIVGQGSYDQLIGRQPVGAIAAQA